MKSYDIYQLILELNVKMSIAKQSDAAMQAMFGNDYWQFEKVISESDLISKKYITLLRYDVETYIIPELKKKDGNDLKQGKAVDFLVYEDDSKNYFKLKLKFEQFFYHLSDATQLYEVMGLTSGKRLGFRYEGWFATLVVKVLT